MFVEQILPRARECLAVVDAGAVIRDAVELMAKPGVDVVVVCERGVMAGVLSKTDVVAELSRRPPGFDLSEPVDEIMAHDAVSCRRGDALLDIWLLMKARGLQGVPVLDAKRRPIGVISVRDALQFLLREVEIEDEQLRDYIAGVGYR